MTIIKNGKCGRCGKTLKLTPALNWKGKRDTYVCEWGHLNFKGKRICK